MMPPSPADAVGQRNDLIKLPEDNLMKLLARVAALCAAGILAVAATPAQAQTKPAGAESTMYAELNFGPTLGHKSDAFVGGEFGLRVMDNLDVIVEASHMGNVGTTDLDDRAVIIANYLGGTAATAFKVNHVAFGARYNFEVSPKVHPYVLAGVGFASVKTDVEFSVNGTAVDPATRGVQLGGDLTGTHNKAIVVFGFGVNVPFKTRFFGDLGYRFGQILAKTDNFETDKRIPTQRIVLGAGIRF
jgi:opacity protein-like surface antigen